VDLAIMREVPWNCGHCDPKGVGEMKWIALLLGVSALVLPASALADQVYHSEHLPLVAVGGAPLQYGFVENVHPNGPHVYAHEMYSLKGALPNTTYQVFLLVHLGDPGCDGSTATNFGFTELTTNAAGNGTADRFIPSVPDAIRNQTHGVRWEVRTTDGTLVYQTACTNVTLD
jgi:hypothetical protein